MIPSIYKHIEPKEFYAIYNLIREHFVDSYDTNKSPSYEEWIRKYNNDNLQSFYNNIALKIESQDKALLLILSNFVENQNGHITGFKLDSPYYLDFLKYSKNIFAIADDFINLCMDINIYDKIKSGQLSDDTIRLKNNFVLMLYINKVIPIVDISIQNDLNKNPIELDYNFDYTFEDERYDIFSKCSIFISLNDDEINYIKNRIENVLLVDRNSNFENDVEFLYNIKY